MIYDPLLHSESQDQVTPEPLADSLDLGPSEAAITLHDRPDQVIVDEGSSQALVVSEVTQVVVDGDASNLTVNEERFQVVVDEESITILSVGEAGPPGVRGPEGPPGNAYIPIAPITLTGLDLSLAAGSTVGEGLVWNSSAWAPQVLVPAGADGTVPYKQSSGLTGDSVNFRYDTAQQALRVPKLEATMLDGGNF